MFSFGSQLFCFFFVCVIHQICWVCVFIENAAVNTHSVTVHNFLDRTEGGNDDSNIWYGIWFEIFGCHIQHQISCNNGDYLCEKRNTAKKNRLRSFGRYAYWFFFYCELELNITIAACTVPQIGCENDIYLEMPKLNLYKFISRLLLAVQFISLLFTTDFIRWNGYSLLKPITTFFS